MRLSPSLAGRSTASRHKRAKKEPLAFEASERSVRNYCAKGRIADAEIIGKTWYIPESAQKPDRVNKKKHAPSLLQILREQKAANLYRTPE